MLVGTGTRLAILDHVRKGKNGKKEVGNPVGPQGHTKVFGLLLKITCSIVTDT